MNFLPTTLYIDLGYTTNIILYINAVMNGEFYCTEKNKYNQKKLIKKF